MNQHNNATTNRMAKLGLTGMLLAFCTTFAASTSAQDDAAIDEPPAEGEIDLAEKPFDPEADQAAMGSERASVKRFEAELDALLLSDGQLDTALGDEAFVKLAGLATRCGILANNAVNDEVKLVLFGYQARALAALTALQPIKEDQGKIALEQLTDVASQIEALDLPGAQPAADYWELITDLARLDSAEQTPTQIRDLTEWLLKRYVDQYEGNEHAGEYLLDARLSLAQMFDQRGAQRAVARQLKHIGKLPPDSPRAQELTRLRESVARLGTPIQFESLSTQLINWRSSDHLGKPVLIHVYADRVEPSVRMIDVISRSIVEGSLRGITVVSLRVGEPIASSSTPPWPTLPVELEPKGVLDQLGVAALPTLAWLNEKGQLVSIGTTPAVLNQFAMFKPDAPDQEQEADTDESQPELPEN